MFNTFQDKFNIRTQIYVLLSRKKGEMDDETNSDVDHKTIHIKTSVHLKNADVNISTKKIETIDQLSSDNSYLLLAIAIDRIQNSDTDTDLTDKLATEQHSYATGTYRFNRETGYGTGQ